MLIIFAIPKAIASQTAEIPNETTNERTVLKMFNLKNISANKNVIEITGNTTCEIILKTLFVSLLIDKIIIAHEAQTAIIAIINVVSSSPL